MNEQVLTYHSNEYSPFDNDGYLYQLIKNRTLVSIPHRHDFFEIVFVLQGNATHNVDGVSTEIKQGQVVFLAPSNVHYFEKQSHNLDVFCLSILSEKFAKFLSAFDFAPVYGKNYTLKNPQLQKEILRLPTMLAQRQKLLINAIVTDFFSEIIRSEPIENAGVPRNLQAAIEQIRRPEYIGDGVEKLAELAGYSRMHLGRLIKRHYGKTPVALLHDIRMSLAAEYLEKTSFTVEKIAENIGLSSLSQFHAAFKKRYGCTPYAYRRQQSARTLVL